MLTCPGWPPWVVALGGEAADWGGWVSSEESLLYLLALLAFRGPWGSLKPLPRFRRQAAGLRLGGHCFCGPASRSPAHRMM